jgi:hypothetical protein
MTYTCFDGRAARLCTASSPTLEADTWEKHGLAFPDLPDVWSKSGSIVARVPSAPRPPAPPARLRLRARLVSRPARPSQYRPDSPPVAARSAPPRRACRGMSD